MRRIRWHIERHGFRDWHGYWQEFEDHVVGLEGHVRASTRRRVLRALWADLHPRESREPEGGDMDDLWRTIAAEGRAEFG